MDWLRLISSKRAGRKVEHHNMEEHRTEFQRDYDRLIFSSPFRRLQNKTQVFPLPGSIFVHNRLTHSLEVSSVGRSLGNDAARELQRIHPELVGSGVDMMGSIVSSACLAHDLGNPPFGHSGERAIASFFAESKGQRLRERIFSENPPDKAEWIWNDIIHFDGNANAFRLLTHQYEGRRPGGYMMTYSVLASIVKYPYTSLLSGGKPKFGFFESEAETFKAVADELGLISLRPEAPMSAMSYARYPLTYFVEAADDICYEIMDIEDAHKLHIISTDDTYNLLLGFFEPDKRALLRNNYPNVTDPNERVMYYRSYVINHIEQECVKAFIRHEDEIMEGRFKGSLLAHTDSTCREAFGRCSDFARANIYKAREVLDVELAGYRIIYTLLDLFTDAILEPEAAYSRLLIDRVPGQYQIRHHTLSGRIRGMLDYITGMTDVYALDLYRKIIGMSLPNV